MWNRSVVRWLAGSVLMVPAMLLGAAYAAGPDAGKGRPAELPMRVQTEGMTYGEYRLHQADVMSRVGGAVPAAAAHAPVRIELTRDEIDSIEKGSQISGTPLRVGLVKAVNPRLDVDGLTSGSETGHSRGPRAQAVATRDGGWGWEVAIQAPGAGALRLHLENLSLPAGAELYFYSRAGEAFGPYRGAGPDGDGDLWTDTLFGDEGLLQLRVAPGTASADLDQVTFRVTEVALVMPRFAGTITPAPDGVCGDPDCLVDVSCAGSTPADPAKDAVAKMEWTSGPYIYTCTGTLLNDANPTQDNFFLTAAHCIGNNKSAKNLQFYWRFRTASCGGSCPSNSGWPYKTSGATLSATGKKGDYSLLHLNTNPPSGSVLLGWSTAAVANSSGAHLYRVSNPDFGPQVYSQHDVDTAFNPCGGWPRGSWIYSRDITGAIDGGSSGSAILNASAQVVGQLSGTCGGAPSDPCASGPGEANTTVDGALASYFASIKPFINP